MSKRNRNKILPVLCLSLCWVYSCSQSSIDQPSTYSKSEQAAYEAALEAAGHAAEMAKELKIAMVAYHLAERTAQLAQTAVAQAEEDRETAREALKQARKVVSSIKEGREKAIIADPAYKTAKAAQDKAWEILDDNRWKASKAEYKKNEKALDKAAKEARRAKRLIEDKLEAKYRAEVTQAKKKESSAYEYLIASKDRVEETEKKTSKVFALPSATYPKSQSGRSPFRKSGTRRLYGSGPRSFPACSRRGHS